MKINNFLLLFLKSAGIYILVLVPSYYLSFFFGVFYSFFLNKSLHITLPANAFVSFVGLPLAYIFFLTFLFTAFGDKHKYWWIGILLIPALWFEISFDLSHLYFPIAIGLLGWLIGLGISKLLPASKTV